jgi:hypothetical protein
LTPISARRPTYTNLLGNPRQVPHGNEKRYIYAPVRRRLDTGRQCRAATGISIARKSNGNNADLGFEAKLWAAADALRGAQARSLGLIFLKCISDAFETKHAGGEGSDISIYGLESKASTRCLSLPHSASSLPSCNNQRA